MSDLLDDVLRRKILVELQRNGRATNQELAERVGASPHPSGVGSKDMEEAGVIRRYVALLDPQAIGVGECVFAQVTIEKHTGKCTTISKRSWLRFPKCSNATRSPVTRIFS
ncbi:MAG: winged helix-turn-helix transcriptional regulator [Geminicoccaceae bacterium]